MTKMPQTTNSTPSCLPAVRSQILQAQEHLQIACEALRQDGLIESADELAVESKKLRIWTQHKGWLWYIEYGTPWPEDATYG